MICYIYLVTCHFCCSSFTLEGPRFTLASFFFMWITFLSISFRAHLLVMNSSNFLSSEYVLIFTLFLKDIFTWCSFLGWEFLQNFLSIVSLFLVFLISNEKSSHLKPYYTKSNISFFLWLLSRYFLVLLYLFGFKSFILMFWFAVCFDFMYFFFFIADHLESVNVYLSTKLCFLELFPQIVFFFFSWASMFLLMVIYGSIHIFESLKSFKISFLKVEWFFFFWFNVILSSPLCYWAKPIFFISDIF